MNAPPDLTAEWNDEDLDRCHVLLSDSIRRHLLDELTRRTEPVATVDELCDALPGDDARTALWHVHLPMLADAGIIDVDWTRETVRYRDGHHIDTLLTQLRTIAEP